MDSANRTRNNKFDRVMSRVHNQSRSSLKSSSFVTRHDIPSSVRLGAKSVVSNVSSSGVFNELPTFLNDYVPESGREKVKRTYVVKPRKTIKSLDVAVSPPRTKPRESVKKSHNITVPESAPSVLINNGEKWSATHLRECLSSRSHSRLKDLKTEIKAYKETEKLMRLRSSLFKKCGVVLDDVGNLAEDKAVQAKLTEEETNDTGQTAIRYPNEYVAPPESMLLPEDLPDDLYENLIDERPELEPILGPSRKTIVRRPKMPKTREKTLATSAPFVYHKFEFPAEPGNEEQIDWSSTRGPGGLDVSSESSAAERSGRKLPLLTRNLTHNDSRLLSRRFPIDYWNPPWDSIPVVATCYSCGFTQPFIPTNPLCHDVFDSQDWRARTMKRFFRSTCHFDWRWKFHFISAKEGFNWHGRNFSDYSSSKLKLLGGFIGGCFKKFLDIGKVYTSRGCRDWWPTYKRQPATTTRFLKLERLLRHHTDRCISSPHASLTPFARGISLFARYHVCVCPGRYCNTATVSKAYHSLLFFNVIFIALFNVMN